MDTRIDEIADHIYRLSTFVADIGPTGFTFNQFVIDAAEPAEDMFGSTCLTPNTAPTIRSLAQLDPKTLAIMHGSSYNGEAGKALLALADDYEHRMAAAS